MLLEKKFYPKPLGPDQFRSLASKYDTYSEEKLQARWSQPNSLVYLGEIALDKGDTEFASRCLKRAVEIEPNHAKAWLLLGLISPAPNEAISCYTQAVLVLEREIQTIRENQPRHIDEKRHPELTIDAKISSQTRDLRNAREGIAFEKKRLLASSDTHMAAARVRLAAPTRVNTWSNCEDEFNNVVRRFWGWLQLLGFAGTLRCRIRFPDGLEGYATTGSVVIDIVPIDEPIDKRNIVEDPESIERLFKQEVLAQLEISPRRAIDLILARVPELENRLVLPVWWWYEKAGDLAYLSGDVNMADTIWAKANVKLKLRYLSAKEPEDIGPNLIRERAKDFLMTYVVPFATPDFYQAAPDPKDPYDKGRNKVQRAYSEEIAAAFKGEVQNWQAEYNMTFLEFLITQVKIEPHMFVFGFPEFGYPESAYFSKQSRYIPTFGDDIRDKVDEWRINAENRVRRAHGLPLRGSLISETLLYEVVKQVLSGMEVVRQHEAWKYLPWLSPQHVDIFVPQLNLGIEYQGEQHFRPVEFFGGEEGFQATVARDTKKRELFDKHGVSLIYVVPEDDLSYDAIRRLLEPFLQGHGKLTQR